MKCSPMRKALWLLLVAMAPLTFAVGAASARADTSSTPRLVVVLTRHGVRSPSDPAELAPFARQPWPAWQVKPGWLTPHGASLMQQFGSYYRRFYQSAGLFTGTGCPQSGSIFVWADLDERTLATGQSLVDGMAAGCGIAVLHASGKEDPLFDPLPALGKVDSLQSLASIRGAIGNNPQSIIAPNRSAFTMLDAILGCTTTCKRLSQVPTTVDVDSDSGLAAVNGGLDLAGTAAEDFLLEYADGHAAVGWGKVDGNALLNLMALHAVKERLEHSTYYNARAEGSNLLSHVMATIDQAASGTKNDQTRVPQSARFVAIVGHDTTLAKFAGMLHLSWLMQGYQFNDTPPGGALVFELYTPAGSTSFVRLFFTAQSLDDMRAGNGGRPNRVPVYIPGCPSLDCPLDTFRSVVNQAVDSRFVGPW